MDQETIIVVDWFVLSLLAPATIILVWKAVSEGFKGKELSSDLITMALILGSAVIGLVQLNIDRSVGWLRWMLLLAQLILIVFLYKKLWSPLMQKLRG